MGAKNPSGRSRVQFIRLHSAVNFLLLDAVDLDIAVKKMYDNRQSDYDASRIDRIRNTAHLPRFPSQTHSLCCLPQR